MKGDFKQKLGNTQIPGLRDIVLVSRILLARRATDFRMESRPGEFGSPTPDLNDLRRREDDVFRHADSIAGVELNESAQLELIRKFEELYRDQPFDDDRRAGLRYYPENIYFGVGAAFVLHCFLRIFRPKRLIEVGSGFSTAAILDTSDRFLNGELSCTFIDPFPDRLSGLLREGDRGRHQILAQPVQQVPLELFDELDQGDILFVDSSHVSRVGSDVNRLVFDVFPRLKAGVLVHIHDIHFPFEYPREWIYQGRAWNESYLLRAFLMFNSDFEILLFNSYLAQVHAAEIEATMPLWGANIGTSLWLRRVEG